MHTLESCMKYIYIESTFDVDVEKHMENPNPENSGHEMVHITVHDGFKEKVLVATAGTRLIDVLRDAEAMVLSPCGGMGICKKCLVVIDKQQVAQACRHILDHDIDVTVPRYAKTRILETPGKKEKPVACDSGIETTVQNGTATFRYEGTVIAQQSHADGQIHTPYGAAIDIGTTTVVVYLEDLSTGKTIDIESFVNPQTAFGADVISRIHFTMGHEAGLARLQSSIVTAINRALEKACRESDVKSECIYKITVAGNPTMLHLLLAIDPSSIARAPFAPAFTEGKFTHAALLGLSAANPGAVALVLPSISGYVGADVVAGIASTPLAENEALSLYLDIGTNGEMALGNRDIIFCCATAAGPAFEGARISCGAGGVDGAICSYENGAYMTISGLPPVGICGSGIVDIVAGLLDKGIIDAKGFMEAGVVIERGEKTGSGTDIVLTPGDVREVQLAKAAIASGIRILIKDAGVVMDDIRHVYLAGAFGNFMNVERACRIGMIPKDLAARVVCAGNAAGTGARLALRSREFSRSLDRIVGISRYIELSGRTDFNDIYVEEMSF
jgi:uncharacterized 2Fe-2S/4Fe-4S cluster protein (DUF4445 family)